MSCATRLCRGLALLAAGTGPVVGCAQRTTVAQPVPPAHTARGADPRTLAQEVGFPAHVVGALQARGTNLRRLVGTDANGDARPAAGLEVDLPKGTEWRKVVGILRDQVGPGYLAFCCGQGFGLSPDEVAVLRGTDQFEILRTMGTDSINHGLTSAQVLARIKQWDGRYGLRIVGAGLDWMQAEFERAPTDMDAFAREVHRFCPDVVEQGTGTVQKLASEMRADNSVYLWWD